MVRVMLFNGRDWEPLDWDVPTNSGDVTHELNHSTMITLEIPPEYNRHEYLDVPRAYKDMAHVVVEDDDGGVYAGVVKDSPVSSTVQITAHGHSVLSKDFPWHGKKGSWEGTDGITVFRSVWAHIIENGGIPRFEVVGASRGGSPVGQRASSTWRQLTDLIEKAEVFVNRRENRVDYWERQLNNRAAEMFRASGRSKVGEVVTMSEPPGTSDAATYKAVIEENEDKRVVAVHFWEWVGVGGGHWVTRGTQSIIEAARRWRTTVASLGRAKDLYPTYAQRAEDLKEQRDELEGAAPEPYELTWWDARDLSANLEEIRELGNFDWHDTARWDGDDLIPGIMILADDRAVREDIHLELGVNVHDIDEQDPGDAATHITVLGEGEGDATIRAERRLDHPRMVPVYRTVSDKDYRTQQLADKAADKERDEARKALGATFSALRVVDHPLAPISSFRLGDRIRLVGELRDGAEIDVVVTVTSIQRDLGGNTIHVEVGIV